LLCVPFPPVMGTLSLQSRVVSFNPNKQKHLPSHFGCCDMLLEIKSIDLLLNRAANTRCDWNQMQLTHIRMQQRCELHKHLQAAKMQLACSKDATHTHIRMQQRCDSHAAKMRLAHTFGGSKDATRTYT